MGVYEQIDIEFPKRTLGILDQYDEQKRSGSDNFEVTLLVNCLVGLLIVPHERRLSSIPNIPLTKLHEWGLEPSFIDSWGIGKTKHKSLRELIRRLRNSIAHFHIEATGNDQDIEYLIFSDQNGFRATIPIANLRQFVRELAKAMGTADRQT